MLLLMTFSALLTILSESYDTEIKAAGVSFASAFLRFMGVVTPLVLGLLTDT